MRNAAIHSLALSVLSFAVSPAAAQGIREGAEPLTGEQAEETFSRLDSDQDGRLRAADARPVGIDPRSFAAADMDSDGFWSHDEFLIGLVVHTQRKGGVVDTELDRRTRDLRKSLRDEGTDTEGAERPRKAETAADGNAKAPNKKVIDQRAEKGRTQLNQRLREGGASPEAAEAAQQKLDRRVRNARKVKAPAGEPSGAGAASAEATAAPAEGGEIAAKQTVLERRAGDARADLDQRLLKADVSEEKAADAKQKLDQRISKALDQQQVEGAAGKSGAEAGDRDAKSDRSPQERAISSRAALTERLSDSQATPKAKDGSKPARGGDRPKKAKDPAAQNQRQDPPRARGAAGGSAEKAGAGKGAERPAERPADRQEAAGQGKASQGDAGAGRPSARSTVRALQAEDTTDAMLEWLRPQAARPSAVSRTSRWSDGDDPATREAQRQAASYRLLDADQYEVYRAQRELEMKDLQKRARQAIATARKTAQDRKDALKTAANQASKSNGSRAGRGNKGRISAGVQRATDVKSNPGILNGGGGNRGGGRGGRGGRRRP